MQIGESEQKFVGAVRKLYEGKQIKIYINLRASQGMTYGALRNWFTLFADINSASLPTDAADVACLFMCGVKSGYQVSVCTRCSHRFHHGA
jgi:hypothetical protein